MSTPFSDDSLLPKPAPAMPVSPHGDEYLLRSARAQWERRATVAADAASELKKAFNSLSAPIEANHSGNASRETRSTRRSYPRFRSWRRSASSTQRGQNSSAGSVAPAG